MLVVADKRRPLPEEIDKMFAANPDGAGVASRVGKDTVKWEKGLTRDEIKDLHPKLPMPYVLHFRRQSCGGISKEITHPFPVERQMRTDLTGTIKGSVLFHNGHWAPYKEKGLDGAIRNKVIVPGGKWTDTRVMAWLTHLHGPGILELIDEKVILFSPTKIEIFHPDGWFRVNDLLVSNRGWESQYVRPQGPYVADDGSDEYEWMHQSSPHLAPKACVFSTCKEPPINGGWYCVEHQPACKWANCKQPREGATEFCGAHQPACSHVLCNEARVVGERFCIQHLGKLPLDRNAPSQSGGTGAPPNFRAGEGVVPDGKDQPGGAGQPSRALVRVGAGVSSTDVLGQPAVLTDPVLQAQSTWARGINEKALRTPREEVQTLLANRELPHSTLLM